MLAGNAEGRSTVFQQDAHQIDHLAVHTVRADHFVRTECTLQS